MWDQQEGILATFIAGTTTIVGVVILGWAEAAVGAIERIVECKVGITSVGVHCIGASSLAAERRCPAVSVSSVQIDVAVEYSYQLDRRNISEHRS
jgi:hypothetical protein